MSSTNGKGWLSGTTILFKAEKSIHNQFFFLEPSACFLNARVTGAAKGEVDFLIKPTANSCENCISISFWSIILHRYGFRYT
ncbi:hypothetical protein PGB90_001471 [Kerria lacca]